MALTHSVAPPQSPCVAGLRGQRSGDKAGAIRRGLQGGYPPLHAGVGREVPCV
jgi:hypothetical protein